MAFECLMITRPFVVICIVWATVINVDAQRCLENYNIVSDTCYHISKDEMPWDQARTSCQKQGGDLAVLHNQTTQQSLSALLETNVGYWIGLQKIPGNSTVGWTWLSKYDVNFNVWSIGEPSNDGGAARDCAHYWFQHGKWRWNDRPCTRGQRYICQKSSSVCSADYTLTSGQCFKIFTDVKSWYDARKICQKDGGDLAVVLNSTQNEYITGAITERGDYWVGLLENPSTVTNGWKWITGDLVEKDQWAVGAPLLSSLLPMDCGLTVYTGSLKWNVTTCSNPRRYICQTAPVLSDLQPVTKESMSFLRNMTSPQNQSDKSYSLCPCNCQRLDINPPPEVLANIVLKIQAALIVEKETLSSKRNKKISAQDNRFENRIIGYVSLCLCAIPILLILASDFLRIVFKIY